MIFCSYLLTNGEDRGGVKPVTVFFVAKTLQNKIKKSQNYILTHKVLRFV